MKTKAFSPSNVLTYATILVSLVCVLGPFLWLIGISLKTRTQILTNPPLFIWKPTFENYAQVLHTDNFLQSLGNSVIISVSTVILSLLIGVPTAYTMARSRFRGRGTMYYSLLLMRMLPGIAVLIPMFMLFEYIGLQGSRSSVVFAHLSFSLPLRSPLVMLPGSLTVRGVRPLGGGAPVLLLLVPRAAPGPPHGVTVQARDAQGQGQSHHEPVRMGDAREHGRPLVEAQEWQGDPSVEDLHIVARHVEEGHGCDK